jgi:hypothetical protein
MLRRIRDLKKFVLRRREKTLVDVVALLLGPAASESPAVVLGWLGERHEITRQVPKTRMRVCLTYRVVQHIREHMA